MAAKKDIGKSEERTYTIPLRKEYQKVPMWKRTKKAVKATREFLLRHFKAEEVRLGKELNEFLWKHGIQNPPAKVKITAARDDKGVVNAELFGVKKKEPVKKETKKASPSEKKEKVEPSPKTSPEAPVKV